MGEPCKVTFFGASYYFLVGNPVSQAFFRVCGKFLRSLGDGIKVYASDSTQLPSLYDFSGDDYNYIRIAGISGATAIVLAAYGKYSFSQIPDLKEQLDVRVHFDTASRIHLMQSFALMAVPLAHMPNLTGALMATGTVMYTGSNYYRAFSGDNGLNVLSIVGGCLLVCGWLSLIL